jgi:hypothetical protein
MVKPSHLGQLMPTRRALKQPDAEALLDRAHLLCDHCCRYTISGSAKLPLSTTLTNILMQASLPTTRYLSVGNVAI